MFHRHVLADKTDHDRPPDGQKDVGQSVGDRKGSNRCRVARLLKQGGKTWIGAPPTDYASQCHNRTADPEDVIREEKDDDLRNQGDRRAKQQKSHPIFLDARERLWGRCNTHKSDKDSQAKIP